MKAKSIAAVVAAVFCGASLAAPAPWYQWRSKVDGALVCAQTSPGEGWIKVPYPYKNPHCKKPPGEQLGN